MNMWRLILCGWFVLGSVLKWFSCDDKFEGFSNFENGNHCSVKCVQSTITDRQSYSQCKLTEVRHVVQNNNKLSMLKPNEYARIKELGINKIGKCTNKKKKTKAERIKMNKLIKSLKRYGPCFDNLITVPVTNERINKSENKINLNILTANVRSLMVQNKDLQLRDYMIMNKIHLGILTETWLKDTEDKWQCSNLNCEPFQLDPINRKNKKGGGIALITHKQIISKKLHPKLKNEYDTFEYGVWACRLNKEQFTIIGIYHPPKQHGIFIDQFLEFLVEILPNYNNVLIMGDLNIHWSKDENPLVELLSDSLFALGLVQMIEVPTHKSGNVLDAIIVENENTLYNIERSEVGDYISDHRIISLHLKINKAKANEKLITRDTSTITNEDISEMFNELRSEIYNVEIPTNQINNLTDEKLCDMYTENLESALINEYNKLAPQLTTTKRIKEIKPWFKKHEKSKIIDLRKNYRSSQKNWLQNRNEENWNKLKMARNKYVNKLNIAKANYFTDKIKRLKGNTAGIYNTINKLTNRIKVNPMPEHDSKKSLANDFSNFFKNKIEKIQEYLNQFPIYVPPQRETPGLLNFQPLTIEDTIKVISSLGNKVCETDPIPTSWINKNKPAFAKLITPLMNKCLTTGHFPNNWKEAVIKPLIKKASIGPVINNYRPVSNLKSISKILEKAALMQITEYCEFNNLIPDNQSAYRKGYSCETALLSFTDVILNSFENQKICAAVALDLSAAFDTVHHEVLLNTLKCFYGIDETVLKFLKSYLNNRSCTVSIEGTFSDPRPLNISVPQGGCSSAFLFILYASTIFVELPNTVNIKGFADDHILLQSFNPNSTMDTLNTFIDLEDNLIDIQDWMNVIKLHMNPNKTELIIFGNKVQLAKCQIGNILVGNERINCSPYIRYLGGFLDENLNMKEHVKRRACNAMYNLRKLKAIRKYLSIETSKIIASALVLSHLDYANILLLNSPNSTIKSYERIQNMCAKIVLNRNKYSSSKEALKELHWLPIKERIKYKLLCIVHSCKFGRAPKYLKNLLHTRKPSRSLRSNTGENSNLLEIPYNKRKTFGDRSFSYMAPKEWNKLPYDLRLTVQEGEFKAKLKTHLFSNVFFF